MSEGSGENLFIVQDGVLYTPPLSSSILGGVTRRCVMALAGDLGIPVREEPISRERLYLADEAFFTGTAAEITPIRSVDGIPVGPDHRQAARRILRNRAGGDPGPPRLADPGKLKKAIRCLVWEGSVSFASPLPPMPGKG